MVAQRHALLVLLARGSCGVPPVHPRNSGAGHAAAPGMMRAMLDAPQDPLHSTQEAHVVAPAWISCFWMPPAGVAIWPRPRVHPSARAAGGRCACRKDHPEVAWRHRCMCDVWASMAAKAVLINTGLGHAHTHSARAPAPAGTQGRAGLCNGRRSRRLATMPISAQACEQAMCSRYGLPRQSLRGQPPQESSPVRGVARCGALAACCGCCSLLLHRARARACIR